jgi:hypothetical protein
MARQWADGYGPRWYLHRDGKPPHDDDGDYAWRYGQWVPANDEDEDDLDLDGFEEQRRERIARENEY